MTRIIPIAALALLLGASAVAAEDTLVGDTLTDVRTPGGAYISWREHIIDDTASAEMLITGSDGLVMADLDGDGFEDIVSVHESDTEYDRQEEGQIRIAFGSADPDQWVNVTLCEGPDAAAAEDAAIGDVNGDGYPDVIAACELAHLIYFQNPGKNARTEPWRRVIPSVARDRGSFIRVFLADVNGDGRLEAVAPNKGEQNPDNDTSAINAISIFEVAGDPLDADAWVEHELGRCRIPMNSMPVDLDADGDLDIIGGSRGENRIFWFENLGTNDFKFREHRINVGDVGGQGFNMVVHDLNHDGRRDIVLAASVGLAWYEQPAGVDEEWTVHVIGDTGPDIIAGIESADIDGDGDIDLITGGYSRGPRDHDGYVGRGTPLGRIAWFQNPGDAAGAWTRHDISRRKRGMFDKFIARDLDGDGDIDFASTRGNSEPYDGVFWLEQVRSAEPRKAFEPARSGESVETPLP